MATSQNVNLQSARVNLQTLLRQWEPAAGPKGFEGLVARALAALTGMTFRLAKSGSQFGRDGATPSGPFSIAMEAKRYSTSVPLQELAGKATLAAFDLAGEIDLWVLAATVEVGETTERLLRQILEREGISLLTLDWTDGSLPPLGVLLASVRAEVLSWVEEQVEDEPERISAVLSAGLDEIAANPEFGAALDELKTMLFSARLGLAAFHDRNSKWCEEIFASRKQAQRRFSQFLAPLASPATTAERPLVRAALSDAVRMAMADEEGDSFVAVLGGEGAGKSWAVVSWWLSLDPRPILLTSVGRIAEHLSPNTDPIQMLANLAAYQDGFVDDDCVAGWERRFKRWSKGVPVAGRFLLLLDGLNETSGKPWGGIINCLLPIIHSLGGVILVTCREGYWRREIEPRLPAYVNAVVVGVGDYDDDEFPDVLSKHLDHAGQALTRDRLTPKLDAFMRNPRICALALSLLPDLESIQDLTVELLLMEYWRARLRERGDLVGHSNEDFNELLIRHAKAYRDRPGTNFNRNEWRSRSGAAERQDGRELAHDLTDIEEGRFFDIRSKTYQFRDETLHFALGLLVADEIRNDAERGRVNLDEVLAEALDPVRGFDAVADILTAAIAVATLDDGYPDLAIATLISGWMSLQNLPDDAFESLIPYVAARPEPFLDAWEGDHLDRDDGRFLQVLMHASQRESVARAFSARVNRWLGSWSRALPGFGDVSERQRRQSAHSAKIASRLEGFSPADHDFLNERCTELPASGGLASAAALFLYGRPLTPYAAGVVAFAFCEVLAANSHSPYSDLSWVIRLNRIDPSEFAEAIRTEVTRLTCDDPSLHAREVAAVALRLLGTAQDEHAADSIFPRPARVSEMATAPDPLDPDAQVSTNIDGLRERVERLDRAQIWSGFWTSAEDHDLERSHTMLVRFDHAAHAQYLDELAKTVATRTGMPLRQLGWHLPALSPVMSEEAVLATIDRIAEIGEDPALVPDGDQDFVTAMLVEACLPGLTAEQQLDLLQSLPPKAPYYFRYSALAKPLTGEVAAARLSAVIADDPGRIERTLLFLSASQIDVTAALRASVLACLQSANSDVSAAASEFVRTRDDAVLDDAVLAMPVPPEEDQSWRGRVVRCAIASAIGRRNRSDFVDQIPVEHLDWVASRVPDARARLADTIEATLAKFTVRLASVEPRDAILALDLHDDPAETRMDVVDRGEGKPADLVSAINAINEEIGDQDGGRFERRQALLNEQIDRFLWSLMSEGALAFARRPYTIGLDELARAMPERFAAWLRTVLATSDPRMLRQLQNLGFALAQNFSGHDPELAARVIAHLWEVESHVVVRVGEAKHAFRHLALFSSPSSPEIDKLREGAFKQSLDDSEIGRLVFAATAAGADQWFERFIDELLLSQTSADHALALTIASFRGHNPHSNQLFAQDWGQGFLGIAANVGNGRYRRSAHADYWFARAVAESNAIERWRCLELGIAAADGRQLLSSSPARQQLLRGFGGDLPQRLAKAAEKALSDLATSFLGHRRPTGLIDEVIRRSGHRAGLINFRE